MTTLGSGKLPDWLLEQKGLTTQDLLNDPARWKWVSAALAGALVVGVFAYIAKPECSCPATAGKVTIVKGAK